MKQDKILWQLLDGFRGSSWHRSEHVELALQALAWAHLTHAKKLPEHLWLTHEMTNEPQRINNALMELATFDGQIGQAFSGLRLIEGDAHQLRPVIDLALRFSATGVLQHFAAGDAAAAAIAEMGRQSLGIGLPSELADLRFGLCDLREGDSLYAPWDFSGQLAMRAADIGADAYVEIPNRTSFPALVSLLSSKAFEVVSSDPIRDPSAIIDGNPKKFSAAIAFPPMGQRYEPDVVDRDLFNRFRERSTSSTVLGIRHLLSQAVGRVVVAVPNNLLFSGGAEELLRKSLLMKGQILAVFGMPTGLLEGTNVSFSILVLQPAGTQKPVGLINVDDDKYRIPVSKARFRLTNVDTLLAQLDEPNDTETVRHKETDELLANDANLEIGRHFLPPSQLRLLMSLIGTKTVELGDLTTTVRPMPVSKHVTECHVREIGAADIPALGFIQSPGRKLYVDPLVARKNNHQFLQPLDVVMIVKGSVGKVGIVPADVPPAGPGAWIAGQSAIVLRVIPSSEIYAETLAVQLRSPIGQELLKILVTGASIPLIKITDLMQLGIILPDAETAQQARAALHRETELQRQIVELQKEQAAVAAQLWAIL